MKYNGHVDIVIGIPALNEESTVKNIVEAFDRGIRTYFPDKNVLIILLDSSSTDKTVGIFNETEILTPKLVIQSTERGKGRNIINLLKFSAENDIECICMVDADIKNVDDSWVYKLVSPVLSGSADFVFPLYKRGKFAGNITNLICRPALFGIYGIFVGQPIGGDFSFNLTYAKELLEKFASTNSQILPIVNEFGIDIFMAHFCLAGGYKYKEVDLGQKLDKPGFFHMDQIYTEVCIVLFYLISEGYFIPQNKTIPVVDEFILDAEPYTAEELLKRKEFALSLREELNKIKLKSFFYSKLQMSSMENNDQISQKEFNDFLVNIIKILQSQPGLSKIVLDEIIGLARPYFHLRISTYFNEIKNKQPKEVEDILIRSCLYIREKLLEQKYV